jgi:SAM-dependent methyltransferase
MNSPILKIGYKLLESQKFYDSYQSCVGAVKYRRNLIEKKEISKFNSFLDIGCGTASTINLLPRQAKYIGIDLSQKYLKKAAERKEGVTLIHGDISKNGWTKFVTFADPVMCIALGIYHHLSDVELNSMLDHCKSVLPKGSQIISMDPVITSRTKKIARWFAENDRGKFVRTPEELENIFHFKGFELRLEVKTAQMRIPLDTIETIAVLL